MSIVNRKPASGLPTRSDTNRAVQPQKVARGLKFRIYEGDPRSNANRSVIPSTFGISKNGLHVYYNILSIL